MAKVFSPQSDRSKRRNVGNRSVIGATAPALFAIFYPGFVDLFHWALGMPGSPQSAVGVIVAALMLMLMFAVPAFGFLHILSDADHSRLPAAFEVRARRLAYATIAAPTLYCFIGVWKFLLSSPVPDEIVWVLIWSFAIVYAIVAPAEATVSSWRRPSSSLRVAHGVTALIIIMFVAFHLTNHLVAWMGQKEHTAVMEIGRKVYRSPVGEPVLVGAMLFQVVTGLFLSWRWSARRLDFHKTFQVASGLFLSIYILGHMNSVFIFARWSMAIPTGWDFATGAPNGLIHDPWSVRLIPHYALGIFLVIGHLFAGLRVVMLAHGASRKSANRIWSAGILFAAALATTIMLAMCGMRL